MQNWKTQFQDRKQVLALAVLASAIFFTYAPSLSYPFINYDDFDYINARIKDGFTAQGIRFALTSTLGYFIPVTWFSFLTETTLFGADRPAIFRLTNLWLHIANALLAYGIAKRTSTSNRCALTVALLFSLHPVQVESVAWISERRGLLASFFALLSVYSFLKYEPSPRRAFFSMSFYVLSILAKPAFVLLPIVLVGLRFAFLEPVKKFQIRRPITALEGVMLLVAIGASIFQINVPDRTIDATRPEGVVSINVGIGQLGMYASKVLLPFQLIIPYRRHVWTSSEALLVAGVFACICLMAVRFAGNRRVTSAYLLWFVALLVPACGFVAVGKHGMANRYLYLPLLGLLLILAQVFSKLSLPQTTSLIIVGFLTFSLCVATRINMAFWRDTESLFKHTLDVDPKNDLARRYLFNEAIREGDFSTAASFTDVAKPAAESIRIMNVGGAYYIRL